MESEKVKEIKKALENCQKNNCLDCPYFIDEKRCRANDLLLDAINLINELESENERLNKSDTSKEESSIEYYNLYKDLKRKNKDLNELCELQRVSIAESFVRENQLKDQIAELEEYIKGNETDAKAFVNGWHKDLQTELKQFAERLIEKKVKLGERFNIYDIDETLKECLCDKHQ